MKLLFSRLANCWRCRTSVLRSGPTLASHQKSVGHWCRYWQQDCAQRNRVMESTHVQQELCTEKPSLGKYPCAAGTLHRETESLKVPMCSRNFAQRNRVVESTHVQQELCTEKPSRGKYPCAAGTLHRET